MKSTRMVGMDGEDGDTTAAATVIAGRKAAVLVVPSPRPQLQTNQTLTRM